MKNIISFKTTFVCASFMMAILLAVPSCQNNQTKTEDSKDVAKDENKAKYNDSDKEKDAKFCVDAAEINLSEIELGKLAQSRSMNAEVKAMGKMMEDEHTVKLNELKALAERKQISIPTTLTQNGLDEVKKLTDENAKNFDKEYCDMMVSGHKKAIDKFEKAADNCVDAEVKTWAANTLPDLRKHLEHAIMCQDNIKKMKK
jgi:putative membrane protein